MKASAAARWLARATLLILILAPRLAFWGSIPAGVDGDEGAYAALGADFYAHPPPLWTIGPNAMPNARLWIVGLVRHVLPGNSIWEARLVTSLIGLLQAFAVVDIARRTSGLAGAVTAALVMALPLEIEWERRMFCNVWTTATWTAALWVMVRAPHSRLAAGIAGGCLALGVYAYHSSRFAPLIVAPVVAVGLLVRRPATLRLLWPGLLGFALIVWPVAYGFWLAPGTLFGHALATSWVSGGLTLTALRARIEATATGLFAGERMFPLGVMPLAVVGVVACASWPLGVVLGTWMLVVTAGLVARNQPTLYAPVAVCMVPAIALAAAAATRWLWWLPALVVLATVSSPLASYFREAALIPLGQGATMAQGAFVHALPAALTVSIAGGPGCGHGVTLMARNGPCRNVTTLQDAEGVVLVYPELESVAAACAEAGWAVRRAEWFGVPVAVCARPGALPAVAVALEAAAAVR